MKNINYLFPLLVFFIGIVGLIILFLGINGIINLPKIKTQETQTSLTEQIISELEKMSPSQFMELENRLQDLKLDIKL